MSEVLIRTDSLDFNFPEPVYQPIEKMGFLSDYEKSIFRAFYEAHEEYVDNRHSEKEKESFQKAHFLLLISFEHWGLLKVPFIQKCCLFYGVVPGGEKLKFIGNGMYKCNSCGNVFSKDCECSCFS